MVFIRQATMDDIQKMQHCNLQCLPENYALRYYLYHIVTWPQLLFVAEDESENGKIVGYVLAKIDEEEKAPSELSAKDRINPNKNKRDGEMTELEKRKQRRDEKLKKQKGRSKVIQSAEDKKEKKKEEKEKEEEPATDEDKNRTKWKHGHITSLAVLRSHRKLGLATKLMLASQRQMLDVYNVDYVSLHVRETNHAAYHLYTNTLKFTKYDIEKKYYADGEDAFDMRKPLTPQYEKHVRDTLKGKHFDK